MLSFLCILAVGVFAIGDKQFSKECEQIVEDVRNSGAPWVAGCGDEELVTSFEDEEIEWVVDWRTSDLLFEVRDQGQCGSCGFFSSTHVLTDRVSIATKTHSPLISAQDAVECCTRKGCSGCHGVMFWNRGTFFHWGPWNHYVDEGLCYDDCKVYENPDMDTVLHCKETCDDGSPITRNKMSVDFGSIGGKMLFDIKYLPDAIEKLKEGPILGCIVVYSDFMQYKGGLYVPVTTTMMGGHAIEVVGVGYYGKEKIPFFLIKNSWTTQWGINGFGMLAIPKVFVNKMWYPGSKWGPYPMKATGEFEDEIIPNTDEDYGEGWVEFAQPVDLPPYDKVVQESAQFAVSHLQIPCQLEEVIDATVIVVSGSLYDLTFNAKCSEKNRLWKTRVHLDINNYYNLISVEEINTEKSHSYGWMIVVAPLALVAIIIGVVYQRKRSTNVNEEKSTPFIRMPDVSISNLQ